jgi:cysteine desulfurase/selenocysteine lyase
MTSPTPFDLARARRDTPGVAGRLFFDSAGASLMPTPVVEAVKAHLDCEMELGGYTAKARAEESLQAVYASVARLIGGHPDEVALMENATRAWDQAFYGLQFRPGDRILTDLSCYGSNYLAFLQSARRTGVEIVPVADAPSGELDLQALEAAIDERTRLIAVTWIPTASGRVNPAAAVGEIARRHDLLYLLDACQAVGHVPVNVADLGCDFLSATGRKYLRGPRGTGFLYVHPRVLNQVEPAVVDVRSAEWLDPTHYRLREDARRYETWEMNYAALLGLGAAVDYALSWSIDVTWSRVRDLAARLRRGLDGLAGVSTQDTGTEQGGIVTFTMDGLEAAAVKERLGARGAIVSVSSPDGQLLDFHRRGLPALVRASVHYFNTDEEVDRLLELVDAL